MVHGFTQIGIVRHGKPMEVQNWPNMIDAPGLMMAVKTFSAKAWTIDYDQDGLYKRATIEVESVEIVYKGVGTVGMFVLEHVQGVSIQGPYFDNNDYPVHTWIGEHPVVESDDPGVDYSVLANKLRLVMPGLMEPAPYPCSCVDRWPDSVWIVIQHLNDAHHPSSVLASGKRDKWSRERIAQWTEELPIDLTVDPAGAERVRLERQRTHELLKKHMTEGVMSQESMDKIVGSLKGKEAG